MALALKPLSSVYNINFKVKAVNKLQFWLEHRIYLGSWNSHGFVLSFPFICLLQGALALATFGVVLRILSLVVLQVVYLYGA